MAIQNRVFKLDLSLGGLDDWDLLQAVFEWKLEKMGLVPGFQVMLHLSQVFPVGQSKEAQKTRLKRLLSQRNEWASVTSEIETPVPQAILEDALRRLNQERLLSQLKTTREILIPYERHLTARTLSGTELPSCSRTSFFRSDFFEFLATQKVKGRSLLNEVPMPVVLTKVRLQPGARRTLAALKAAYPQPLSVKALAPLTLMDACSELTPRGSLDVWLNQLKKYGLVQDDATQRPKVWFFVTDYKP